MDLPSSWTFVLFTLCFVALIAGALLGFAVGFRTGGQTRTLSVGEGEAETE